jgi:predicted transcriptional regulator
MSISAAESRIMEALWRRSPLTAEEIVAEVAGPQGWSEATVKSLINRLLTKDVIEAEKAGRRYLYRPRVDRLAYLSQESRGLLERLFGGRIAPLVSHFSETNQLSAEDIAELKRLIAELDDDQ